MNKKKIDGGFNPYRPNLWGMIQTICVTSMNKGQFPLVLVGAIFAYMIYRMPDNEIMPFVYKCFYSLERGYILGWILGSSGLLGWFYHVKFIRRITSMEMVRINSEKKLLQEKAIGRKLNSSNQ